VKLIPLHRIIVAFDMEKSTHPLRTNPIKGELRSQIYQLLREAMLDAGIEAAHCDAFADRGDGILMLIRPVDEVPKPTLITRLAPRLAELLDDYNRNLPRADGGRRRLRLRMVVHAGEVHRDGNGCFGEAIEVACRLLDSPQLKRHLNESPDSLALVVSDDIYWGVVRHEYDGIQASCYRSQVRTHVGGRRRTGWVCRSTELMRSRPAAGRDKVS
jgi:hypothetical protein